MNDTPLAFTEMLTVLQRQEKLLENIVSLLGAAESKTTEPASRGPHQIDLNDYQVANLRAAIEAIGYPSGTAQSPLSVLHSGDWLGEIYSKLPKLYVQPNLRPHEYISRANGWRKQS